VFNLLSINRIYNGHEAAAKDAFAGCGKGTCTLKYHENMKAGRVPMTQQTACFRHPRSRFLQDVAKTMYVDGSNADISSDYSG